MLRIYTYQAGQGFVDRNKNVGKNPHFLAHRFHCIQTYFYKIELRTAMYADLDQLVRNLKLPQYASV